MEKMPYQPHLDSTPRPARVEQTIHTDWRSALPLLTGSLITLRELQLSDAPSLFAMLATEEVSRFISPPPTTVEGFERFILWTLRQKTTRQMSTSHTTI